MIRQIYHNGEWRTQPEAIDDSSGDPSRLEGVIAYIMIYLFVYDDIIQYPGMIDDLTGQIKWIKKGIAYKEISIYLIIYVITRRFGMKENWNQTSMLC